MIDFQNKFIYIHIPKTAGIFIESLLHNDACIFDLVDPIALFGHNIEKLSDMGSEHFSLDEIYDLKILSLRQINTFYKFAFVRNPWDRMISEIFYLNRVCRWFALRYKEHFASQDISYIIEDCCQNYAGLHHGIWGGHFAPQICYLQKDKRNFGLDFVGYFENLQKDLEHIINLRGLAINFSIDSAPVNTTKHDHYSKYYDNKSIDAVFKTYKDDVKLFGYEFGK